MSIISFLPKHRLNLPFMDFSIFRSSSLYLTLLFTSLLTYTQSASSQVVFGQGPVLQTVPSFGENSQVQIGSPASCPVPSFNISAFGATGNDFANQSDTSFASSSRGINNYGAAIGFNIPFGGGAVSEFCDEFGKNRAAFERTRRENQLRNSQLSLLQQCYWLQTAGFLNDKNKEIFSTNENFSSLLPCFEVNLDRSTASITNPLESSPPKSNTEPSEEPGTVIQDQRR